MKMKEKQLAAEKSIEFIKEGMILGIGTGSTVFYLINKLAEKVKNGFDIKCVSTSKRTTELAKSLGIRILDLNKLDHIDITIDGADEVDKNLNGIKGGGGALLFEKIIATASKKNIWIIDSTKLVKKIGKFPLPVEVVPYGYNHVLKQFDSLGFKPKLRMNEKEIYLTDSGNYIIDLNLSEINDSVKLEKQIKLLPGVVEVGLFNNLADLVIIGKNSSTEIIKRARRKKVESENLFFSL
jgi:ribose 5-phosphate isomerase A